MSWMSHLLNTYENNMTNNESMEIKLTPIAHINANAHIEVMLSENGEFLSATIINKEDSNTTIPVTEASAIRSSGIAPHTLSDTLSYIAGDYCDYCEKEKQAELAIKKYDAYITGLQKWVYSDYTNPKIVAIYKYLLQKKLISDLIQCGIVELQENGTFNTKKISGKPYENAIVRFLVLNDDDKPSETWKDTSLIQAYIDYYLNAQKGIKDICYITGHQRIISENHPRGIVAANYGAKLVSANDNQGYTYRGRFQNAGQAYSLSYEASQKIHSALTWLVKTQGAYVGTQDKRTFVCWNPNGKKVPNILDEFGWTDDSTENISYENYRKKLIKSFQGYQNQFDATDEVIVLGLDAATTGRLSITYYFEINATEFLHRLVKWGNSCKWLYLKFNEHKKPYYRLETPIFYKIVRCAFGNETEKYIEVNDKVLKEQTQRLIKCMLEEQPFPRDIMQAIVIKASTPLAYSRRSREEVLSTACAIVVKYHYDRGMKGVCENMTLDKENRDRSYLFGRLLAVFEKVERVTYDRDEKRDPNAIRLQSAYVNHPLQTWKILEGLLNPYFQKLSPGTREYYKKIISEIVILFKDEDEQKLNQSLKETYLLGYYLQRAELNKGKDE